MANQRQIKRRISTTDNISQITKAMEMVAASKMRRAQEQATKSRAYTRAMNQSLQKIAANTDASLHPLLETNDYGDDVLIVIGTDKGLCGPLNTNLFKAAERFRANHDSPKLIAVGKKVVTYARRTGFDMVAQFTDMPDHITTEDILPISEMVMDKFLKEEFKSVTVLYTDFINTLTQKVRISPLLPIAQDEYEGEKDMITTETEKEYVFEPSAAVLLKEILPYYVENSVYQVFLESKASEHSARMVAMKNASENADDLKDDLELEYNRSRQAAITNEILDITTAALSLDG